MVIEFRVVMLGLMGREQNGTFWSSGNVPYPHQGNGLMVVYTGKNPVSRTWKTCKLYCM